MIEFDDLELVMAQSVTPEAPRPEVRPRLMARIRDEAAAESRTAGTTATVRSDQAMAAASDLPAGFTFSFEDDNWHPHPVPGIRMKLLALNRERHYATVLFDVAPGTTFPGHHHSGPEECYVISGTVRACGRTIGPGDFHHADGDTDHGELYTETGCRVLLVVAPEDYLSPS